MTNGSQISVEQLKVASPLTIRIGLLSNYWTGVLAGTQRCCGRGAPRSYTNTNNVLPKPCQEREASSLSAPSRPRAPPAAACFLTSSYSGLRLEMRGRLLPRAQEEPQCGRSAMGRSLARGREGGREAENGPLLAGGCSKAERCF